MRKHFHFTGAVGVATALLLSVFPVSGADAPQRHLSVLVVVGAPGSPTYGEKFAQETTSWKAACAKAGLKVITIGSEAESKVRTDAQALRESIEKVITTEDALWLVLIGHGSFDGREAKFNLRGPDIVADDLASWLKPMKHDVAIIQTASSSAPFLRALSAPNRVVVSATKSADEVFYTRFGEFFAKAIGGVPDADMDHDEQVSLLEAFLWSSKQVDRFFETEGRIATEHALMDDNGDGLGTRADWFEGLRCVKLAKEDAKPDGNLARQWSLLLNPDEARLSDDVRKQRDALERQVQELRSRKDATPADEYYARLEKLMIEIAKLTAGESKAPAQ
jgi:hypothetical protein